MWGFLAGGDCLHSAFSKAGLAVIASVGVGLRGRGG